MKKYFVFWVLCLSGLVGKGQSIRFTIDPSNTAQTIDNFGTSAAWFSEGIGKHWAPGKKERLAELLFSKKFSAAGNPIGIGLSAFRFNIGGGTAEQGDSSGIKDPLRRVEGFLSPDGSYNWRKQEGYLWFARKAAQYGVENLIAFSNTPPVQFTKNGLGFKLEKNHEANLREDRYSHYAGFLATVLKHFEAEGLRFNYISPVNEPQWDWANPFGQMNQEGSPWHNKDIYRVALALDSALSANQLHSRILLPEAGMLTELYAGQGQASRQIQNFFNPAGAYFLGGLKNLKPVVAGHSYFTDKGDSATIAVRARLKDTAAKYGVPFWQSEYSMLGEGYKEGKEGRIPAMDGALFLAKLIYYDLTIANAEAWQFWNAWEPGNAAFNTRYYLVALQPNATNTEGEFTVTKNLWALGHYSRFIRPGMKRIFVTRNENAVDLTGGQEVMLSAFANDKEWVMVAVNYSSGGKKITLDLPGAGKIKNSRQYVTTAAAEENMKLYPLPSLDNITLKPRSITTFVIPR